MYMSHRQWTSYQQLLISVLMVLLLHLQLRLTSQCSGSIQNLKRVSLILDDEEQLEEFGLTGLAPSDQQSGKN